MEAIVNSVGEALMWAKDYVKEIAGPIILTLNSWEDLKEEFEKTTFNNQRFLQLEIRDWLLNQEDNPGEPWKYDPVRWKPYLNANGKFDYRYPERIGMKLGVIICELVKNPGTRRAYLSIWDPSEDPIGECDRMVPCVLGFHFYITGDTLNLNVVMRSLDVEFCLINDIWLAIHLLEYVGKSLNTGYNFRLTIIASHAHINGRRGR